MRITFGGGDGIFHIADHAFEDVAARVNAMFDCDFCCRRFDRIAFGQGGFVSCARTVEFALVDPAQLHRQRVAHDIEPDADQDHEPGDRRLVIFRHDRSERHAGERRRVDIPRVDGLRRDELSCSRRLFGGRIILRQRRIGRGQRDGGGRDRRGQRRHRIRHGMAPVGREKFGRRYRQTWLRFRKPSARRQSLGA